jgi:uncharacterized protein YdeI (YjbR/CyaY-like superfamily)
LENVFVGSPEKTLHVADKKSWRAWLAKHHKSETEIWLIYFRKETGKPRISYNDAVLEALCYGWIDSENNLSIRAKHYGRLGSRTGDCRT